MNKSALKKVFVVCLSLFVLCSQAYATLPVTLYTIEIPPISYDSENGPKGPLVDFAKLVFEEAGIDYRVKHLPIPRMLRLLSADREEACTPAFARIQSRENSFTWIHYIVDIVGGVYKKNSSSITTKNIESLKNYKIAIQRGTTTGLFIKRKNINVHEVPTVQMLLQLLNNARADLVVSDHATFLAYANKQKSPIDITMELSRIPTYLMCSKSLKQETVRLLTKAAKRLIAEENQLKKLFKKYKLEDVFDNIFSAYRINGYAPQ